MPKKKPSDPRDDLPHDVQRLRFVGFSKVGTTLAAMNLYLPDGTAIPNVRSASCEVNFDANKSGHQVTLVLHDTTVEPMHEAEFVPPPSKAELQEAADKLRDAAQQVLGMASQQTMSHEAIAELAYRIAVYDKLRTREG